MTRARAALLALGALAGLHVAAVGSWVVDDAAIAWAFARNWANGLGLVPFAGGERVEGYSDFLWVLLLAAGELVGVDSWVTSKVLGGAMVVATVPLVYDLAARALPRNPTVAGFCAAALFAADTQVAIFGASGLENALFCLLLALGLWLAEAEGRTGGTPWSALPFLGLAVTRPEGIAYAAVAGFAALVRTERSAAGLRRIGVWLALFWLPFAAYHGVRWWYFGWPYPMTYYAKVRSSPTKMLDATSEGWGYVMGYLHELGRVWFLGLLPVGRLTLGRFRPLLGVVLVAGLVLGFVPGLPPQVFAIGWLAVGFVLGAPAFHERGPHGLTALLWAMGLVSTTFALYAQGDWMGSFRWLSFATVPLAVLLGAGLAEVAAVAWSRARPAAVAAVGVALGAWVAQNLSHTRTFAANPDINPYSVRERVAEALVMFRRFHVDERPRIMTIDMGGFLWWSDMELMDFVGLIDVTYARQSARYRRELAEDWLAVRHTPHLVFVSDHETALMRKWQATREAFVDHGTQQSIRRSLLFRRLDPGERPVVDAGQVQVWGVSAPGGPVSEVLYAEVAVSTPSRDPFSARLLLAPLDGPPVASWPLPLAGGMVAPERWRPDEVNEGRYHLGLPAGLAEGTWRLGLRLTLDGAPLVPDVLPDGVTADDTGALWTGATVEITTPDGARAAMAHAVDAVVTELEGPEPDCAAAERAWFLVRRRFLDPGPADAAFAERLRPLLATCLATRAVEDDDLLPWLARAVALDPTAPGVAPARDREVARAQERCDAARVDEDWETCLTWCDLVMTLEPTRSWTRRTAEECRSQHYERLRAERKAVERR